MQTDGHWTLFDQKSLGELKIDNSN